jgi:PAS domain S-box-containing protein
MTNSHKRTVLIVDDEPLANQTIAGILQKNGYATVSATTAQQSIEIMRRTERPELVLMDIELGAGMDGVGAAQVIIRESAAPILFLSGHTEPEYVSRTEDVSSYGFVSKDIGETVLVASVKMAFRLYDARKAAQEREAALQASEARYRSLFDEAPVGYHELNMDGQVTAINQTELKMLGYERQELIGKSIWQVVVEPESKATVGAKLAGRLLPGKGYERTFRRKDGSTFPVIVDDVILFDNDGNTVGIRSTLQDMSRHREADRRLHESEERYRILVENATETITVLQNGIVKFVNAQAEVLTGFSRRELLGRPIIDFVLPEDRERVLTNQERRLRNQIDSTEAETLRLVRRDGSIRWFEVRATVISWGGAPATLNFLMDLTDRRETENALARALEEKSYLLKELQQRVKNGLTLISSLVSIEAGRLSDPTAITSLGNLRDRVNSLTQMYLLMDQSGNFQNIQIDSYFNHIVRSLSERYLQGRTDVKVNGRYDRMTVDVKIASACGIILNELVSNALRFAFPPGQPGEITIDVSAKPRELLILVDDNGVGPGEGFSLDSGTGLGMRIVSVLIEQYHGRVSYARTDHTVFTVSIPLVWPVHATNTGGHRIIE